MLLKHVISWFTDQSRGRGLKEVTHIRFRLRTVIACSEAPKRQADLIVPLPLEYDQAHRQGSGESRGFG
jgi:hypothetical protein